MPYSSSLTDLEWEIIAPLLPKKMQTRPPKWTKRQILDGVFYQPKNAVIGATCLKIYRPTLQYSQHDKQWRNEGVLDEIMSRMVLRKAETLVV